MAGIKFVDEGKLMYLDEGSRIILQIGSEQDKFLADKEFLERINKKGMPFNYEALLKELNDLVALNLLHERILGNKKIFTVPRLLKNLL